jgi:hypothetical protein
MDHIDRLASNEAFSEASSYFVLEAALVDGALPDPSANWEATGTWIAPYQWAMLVYMWSNADIMSTSYSFSGMHAAWQYAGLNRDIPRQRTEQGRRKRDLFLGLEQAGLLEFIRKSPQGKRTYRELKLAPVYTASGVRPSGEARTWANLSRSGRRWFKMSYEPFVDPPQQRRYCVWAKASDTERRALTALYLFYDGRTFGAVDPNHLCLRGNVLVMSESFRRAVGRQASVDEAAEALGALWRLGLIAFMAARFDEEQVYPAQPPSIRFATRVQDVGSVETAIVGLRYVPYAADPGEADD